MISLLSEDTRDVLSLSLPTRRSGTSHITYNQDERTGWTQSGGIYHLYLESSVVGERNLLRSGEWMTRSESGSGVRQYTRDTMVVSTLLHNGSSESLSCLFRVELGSTGETGRPQDQHKLERRTLDTPNLCRL